MGLKQFICIIESSVPFDSNVMDTKRDKDRKHSDLAFYKIRLHHKYEGGAIPMVLNALGLVPLGRQ